MPFNTPDGPAILVASVCNVATLSERLGVHYNSIYSWIQNREETGFPGTLDFPVGSYYDYDEVYTWFHEWVLKHPKHYPVAYAALVEQAS